MLGDSRTIHYNTDIGNKIISVAIFNDVVALSILGIVMDSLKLSPSNINNIPLSAIGLSVGYTLLKVIIFMIAIYVAFRLLDKLTKRRNYTKTRIDRIVSKLKAKNHYLQLFLFSYLPLQAYRNWLVCIL